MSRRRFIAIARVALLACTSAALADAPPTLKDAPFITRDGDRWTLSFDDEFDGPTLDPAKWTPLLPWGGTDGTGRHHNPLYASYIADDNVELKDGVLRLLTQRKDVTAADGKTYHYTQALITTAKTFRQQYGYFEARVKLPVAAGPGLWPAFWTLADGWPPEMDICEIWTSLNRSHQGLAYRPAGSAREKWDDTNTTTPLPDDWTTYGMEWGPGYQLYNINGTVTHRVYGDPADAGGPHYLLLNSGVDAKNPPRDSTQFPNAFEVDYVRVYARPAVPALHNGDFSGPTLAPWTTYGQAAVARQGDRFAVRVDGPDSSVEQKVYGLKPNTNYRLSAAVRNAGDTEVRLGVKHYDGTTDECWVSIPAGNPNDRSVSNPRLTFATGPDATTAVIYAHVPKAGCGFVSDFTFVEAE